MALIKKTFGAFGDYADPSAIWIWLCSLGALNNDYEFRQVGDCTINNTWPDVSIAGNRVNLNNHIVDIYCNRDYVINLTGGASGVMRIRTDNGSYPGCKFNLSGLNIIQLSSISLNLLQIGEWVSGLANTTIYTLQDITLYGFSNWLSTGFHMPHNSCVYDVFNCVIYKILRAIYITESGGGGVDIPDPTRYNQLENITIYDSGRPPQYAVQTRGDTPNIRKVNYKNIVACSGSAVKAWPLSINNVSNFIYNCRDDDGSLDAAIANGFLNAVDCSPSIIVPADEFQSLDDTNPSFLNLIQGVGSLDANASPLRGKAPMKVGFNAEALLDGYAPNLGKNGAAPQIPGNDEDISGNKRPGYDGAYSIGAYEQQYTNFEG